MPKSFLAFGVSFPFGSCVKLFMPGPVLPPFGVLAGLNFSLSIVRPILLGVFKVDFGAELALAGGSVMTNLGFRPFWPLLEGD